MRERHSWAGILAGSVVDPMITLTAAGRPHAATTRRPVVMHWSVSSFSGWNVYGLNLALHWSGDKNIEPVCSRSVIPENIAVDPLRERALSPFIRGSLDFQDRLAAQAGQRIEVFSLMLAGVNAHFVIPHAVHDICMSGRPTIGYRRDIL